MGDPRKLRCRCGCGEHAVAIVQVVDYRGGKPTDEPVCIGALAYLRDSAADLNLPFRIVADARGARRG